ATSSTATTWTDHGHPLLLTGFIAALQLLASATRTAREAAAVPHRAAPAGWSPERDRACPVARPAARRDLPRSPSPATSARWGRTPTRPRSRTAARDPAQRR